MAPASAPELRDRALSLFRVALDAVEPGRLTCAALSRLPSEIRRALELRKGRLIAIAAGKAACPMAQAAEDAFQGLLSRGLAVVPRGHEGKLRRLRTLTAGHPLPDEAGVAATAAVVEEVARLTEADVVLVLLSGGASALLGGPVEGVTLEDARATVALLLESGVPIDAVNDVRKHISVLGGGQLVRAARPAHVIALAMSDVPGDRLDVVASGPTVPDPSTFGDALAVLDRYGLRARVPEAVRKRLERGARRGSGAPKETPKRGDPLFERVETALIGSNATALEAAARAAREAGYRVALIREPVQGEAREAGAALAATLLGERAAGRAPVCLLAGGETTVVVRGDGLGGRNQEVALGAAFSLGGERSVALLAAATDGRDGPTAAAGAVVDGGTLPDAEARGLDARAALARNDSLRFFEGLGYGHIVTGPTLTNVMDVYVGIAT